MNSLRKWLYRPKKTDTSFLAQFYFADENLNLVAAELDSFDGRKDPERCTMLVNQLRVCQDKVLNVIQKIMDDCIPDQRANRDFRVKFPDDVLQDGLAGQLWFGAECLASGSSILNREVESASMRPLARALTKNLDSLRTVLRDQCLRSINEYNDRIKEALIIFDKLFAEFELSYVSAMVPVKSMKEHDMLQEVTILFSETVQRALKMHLLTQDRIDDYDPALMFTIPRLAIVCGLLVYPEGPLNPDMEPTSMTEMFRPFQTLLYKIRELLYTLSPQELAMLEKSLCSSEEPEVSTPTMLGNHNDSLLQVDQGFDEDGEGIVPLEGLGSSILVHSPSSGSPVTPVNTHPDIADLEQLSPSTVVESDFRFSPNNALSQSDSEETYSGLNKSESQDSGLQSENVSMSGTVTADCPPISSHEGEVTTTCKLTSSDTKSNVCESALISEEVEESIDCNSPTEQSSSPSSENVISSSSCDDMCVKSCCRLERDTGVHDLCEEILQEILVNVVSVSEGAIHINYSNCDTTHHRDSSHTNPQHCDSNESNTDKTDCDKMVDVDKTSSDMVSDSDNATGTNTYSRQFSWQYNIQFAIPKLTLSDPEVETGQDGQSVGSFSSDSSVSETGPRDSVAEFVVETLAQMNGSDTQNTKQFVHKPNSKPPTPRHLPVTASSVSTREVKISTLRKTHDSNIDSVETDEISSNSLTIDVSNQNHSQIVSSNLSDSQESSQTTVLQQTTARQSADSRELDVTNVIVDKCGGADPGMGSCESPRVRELKHVNSDTRSCQSASSNTSECDCDRDCMCAVSDTSSYNSETNDEEEIALAIKAAEMASRNEARARFRSSSDMIHRLFVCIAGVADQLQTNYASDLRHILKCVFEMNSTNLPEPEPVEEGEEEGDDGEEEISPPVSSTDTPAASTTAPPRTVDVTTTTPTPAQHPPTHRIFDAVPPEWVPDEEVERCTACKTPFTFMRRRHHCRNCGKIFCGKCSSTTVPLPQYGHQKPVRVCHRCFLYQVTHFTVSG